MAVCWGVRAEKQGQLVELGGDQSPSPKAPPRSKRKRSQGDVREGTNAREAMEKERGVGGH